MRLTVDTDAGKARSGLAPLLSPDDAVAVARATGRALAATDRGRDLHRALPYAEMKALAATGLLAATVPAAQAGPLHVAWVRANAPGVEIADDWDAPGQRTTGSGTVLLRDVAVTDDRITPFSGTFDIPTTYGAFSQLLHAAIDAGIARRALDDAGEFVRAKSRPYPDAGVERAVDDPVIVRGFGERVVLTKEHE